MTSALSLRSCQRFAMAALAGWKRFASDSSAAVASTFALSMVALVAVIGVAWDWTRMTALDSELQNAADQAALAAATQLDGKSDAIDRATDAANDLITNGSLMSNDGDGFELAVDSLIFYNGYNQSTDTFGAVTSSDSAARAVRVFIEPREAVFSLTPVVGLFRSGGIGAQAAASLGSAICNTPPVMICNPLEGNADDDDFNPNNYVGYGLRLIADNDNGAPGNFGFLASGIGNGASELSGALGYDSVPGNCVPGNGVTTKPGLNDVVFNAINTRFDLSINGANTCPTGGSCSSAPISRKDLVKTDASAAQCGITGQGWQQAAIGTRYVPPSARMLDAAERAAVKVMGHPRDLCHAWSEDGDCETDDYGVIGTGEWDRNAFFEVNYGWSSAQWPLNTGLSANATRYQVYQWETARYEAGNLSSSEDIQSDGSKNAYATPVCRAEGNASRRTMTAAVVNCAKQGVAGRTENVQVEYWMEFFLVEPSFSRKVAGNSSDTLTDANDVYVEVIRAVDVGGDGSAGEVVRRDIPYLIR